MKICIQADERGRIELIDCLKGFSIFTIALMHLLRYMSAMPSPIITLSGIGGTGVHVFFLCSGLGLTLSFSRRRLGFPEFVMKRMAKIYLPYIFVVAVSFLLPWMYSGDDRVMALLSHVFLFKMFMPQYVESFGQQFWFMSAIFQLYLLFIPMYRLKERMGGKGFFALCMCVSVAWWILCYVTGMGKSRIWGSFCLQYVWEFALGMVLADQLGRGKRYELSVWLLALLALAGIGLQAGAALLSESLNVFNDVPALVGYASLELLLCRIPLVRRVCSWLSVFSFDYYLVHILVFVTAFHLISPQGLAMQCLVGAVSMAAALAAAYGYHLLQSKGRKNRKPAA